MYQRKELPVKSNTRLTNNNEPVKVKRDNKSFISSNIKIESGGYKEEGEEGEGEGNNNDKKIGKERKSLSSVVYIYIYYNHIFIQKPHKRGSKSERVNDDTTVYMENSSEKKKLLQKQTSDTVY